MTTFLLVRHGSHDLLGKKLTGRMPGVLLNKKGIREANELAGRVALMLPHAIYSSPSERARQTAAPLAASLGLEIYLAPAIDDIEFGQWTNRSFASLESDPQWLVWCSTRSAAAPPGGETIQAVQIRALNELERLNRIYPDEIVVLFSHCDVIKTILAGILGISLDKLETFEVAPASVSKVIFSSDWQQVKSINCTDLVA